MAKIDSLKARIESLPSEEIAADSDAGRPDFLEREVRDEKAKEKPRDL
jgi:hypothetical protein